MLVPAMIAAATIVMASPEDVSSLKLDLSMHPSEIMEYDVVFVRVTITNVGKRPLLLPRRAGPEDGSLVLLLSGKQAEKTYQYPHPSAGQFDIWRFREQLAPGKSRVLYESLVGSFGVEPIRVPPPGEADKPFWRELGGELHIKARLILDASMWLDAEERAKREGPAGVPPDFVVMHAEAPAIRVKPRPREELALLLEPWRPRPDGEPAKKPWEHLKPRTFSALVPPGCETPGDLQTLEQSLSPGTCRNSIHLYRLITTIYYAPEASQWARTAKEVFDWLSTLPEPERQSMVRAVVSWAWQVALADRRWFEILYAYACSQPAPRLREQRLQGCCHLPGFPGFLERKGESYPWIEEHKKREAEPRKPPAQPKRPPRRDPALPPVPGAPVPPPPPPFVPKYPMDDAPDEPIIFPVPQPATAPGSGTP